MAAMQQIADWLEKLGLGQYAQRFGENDINFSILSDLTDQDLKEIGVSSLGHRRHLLRAIAELNAVEKGAPTPPPAAASVAPQDTAERRQVTVMFSDLVGSTALSARMDPEDLREVISTYQKCVAETVSHFGGFVAKYMGDGVLVYFGCKFACNSDPLRGDFRVQFRPLLTFCVSVLPFGPEGPGRTLGDDWRGQDRPDTTRLF
jgi:hypothetical protein